jgi:HEAT repeat protein
VTFFCPACWSEIEPSDSHCPKCGADVRALDGQSFSEKLCAALRHPEPQTAVRAAWILGERREQSALEDLIHTLQTTKDGFLAEAAADALGKIGGVEVIPSLEHAASKGPIRVRLAAKRALQEIQASQKAHR